MVEELWGGRDTARTGTDSSVLVEGGGPRSALTTLASEAAGPPSPLLLLVAASILPGSIIQELEGRRGKRSMAIGRSQFCCRARRTSGQLQAAALRMRARSLDVPVSWPRPADRGPS